MTGSVLGAGELKGKGMFLECPQCQRVYICDDDSGINITFRDVTAVEAWEAYFGALDLCMRAGIGFTNVKNTLDIILLTASALVERHQDNRENPMGPPTESC